MATDLYLIIFTTLVIHEMIPATTLVVAEEDPLYLLVLAPEKLRPGSEVSSRELHRDEDKLSAEIDVELLTAELHDHEWADALLSIPARCLYEGGLAGVMRATGARRPTSLIRFLGAV